MPQNGSFYQDLYCLLTVKHFPGTDVHIILKVVIDGLIIRSSNLLRLIDLNLHKEFISFLSYKLYCCTLPDKHGLSNGRCLYQVMMTLHFLNDIANNAELTQN